MNIEGLIIWTRKCGLHEASKLEFVYGHRA